MAAAFERSGQPDVDHREDLRFGQQAQMVGRLQTTDGRPIPNAEVQVLSRSALLPERLEAVIRTDGGGNYAYLAGPGSTRTIRFSYLGTPVTLPSTSEAALLVPAASTIRPRPRRCPRGYVDAYNERAKLRSRIVTRGRFVAGARSEEILPLRTENSDSVTLIVEGVAPGYRAAALVA